ncbi:class II fructose-bisphosphate aldolase [Sulfurirhabdus autotrophica]|uniref:Fructose-bisphosphate aldolase n=1 Tax=Sulfurirhabdus autotrophica TaxID=1706046 RepID=A0A4R3YC61_9PROT|nr:class II fructose-bisphosphate aldolase [Sulfurirhabdus autotrophica]TCV89586.1 fructose-bisphosphate aldolase [Sulfurirhabdus autotrophica]
MPLVDMKDMLSHAYSHGYAVGAFGVAGWDILEGVVEAAESMRAPIILSVSKSYPGTDNIESLARAVIEMGQRASIPVAFQIEVEDTLEAAQAAIEMGCGGVVFNASTRPLPENVSFTQKVVGLAEPHGVMVVGQVGQLESEQANDGGESSPVGSTSPLEAKYYVERAGVGCLAVSVNRMNSGGNKYDFTRLSKINQAVGIPLGIHDSVGFTDDQLRRMIGFGAAKVNYSTTLLDIAAKRIRENALAGVEGYAATMAGVRDVVRQEVERCIKVWGSGGRAAEVLLQCKLHEPVSAKSLADAGKAKTGATEKIKPIFGRLVP